VKHVTDYNGVKDGMGI